MKAILFVELDLGISFSVAKMRHKRFNGCFTMTDGVFMTEKKIEVFLVRPDTLICV